MAFFHVPFFLLLRPLKRSALRLVPLTSQSPDSGGFSLLPFKDLLFSLLALEIVEPLTPAFLFPNILTPHPFKLSSVTHTAGPT